jgi:hypothetical protein
LLLLLLWLPPHVCPRSTVTVHREFPDDAPFMALLKDAPESWRKIATGKNMLPARPRGFKKDIEVVRCTCKIESCNHLHMMPCVCLSTVVTQPPVSRMLLCVAYCVRSQMYSRSMLTVGHALMEALAVGLDLPRKHFETNNITRDSYWGLRVRDIGRSSTVPQAVASMC